MFGSGGITKSLLEPSCRYQPLSHSFQSRCSTSTYSEKVFDSQIIGPLYSRVTSHHASVIYIIYLANQNLTFFLKLEVHNLKIYNRKTIYVALVLSGFYFCIAVWDFLLLQYLEWPQENLVSSIQFLQTIHCYDTAHVLLTLKKNPRMLCSTWKLKVTIIIIITSLVNFFFERVYLKFKSESKK